MNQTILALLGALSVYGLSALALPGTGVAARPAGCDLAADEETQAAAVQLHEDDRETG